MKGRHALRPFRLRSVCLVIAVTVSGCSDDASSGGTEDDVVDVAGDSSADLPDDLAADSVDDARDVTGDVAPDPIDDTTDLTDSARDPVDETGDAGVDPVVDGTDSSTDAPEDAGDGGEDADDDPDVDMAGTDSDPIDVDTGPPDEDDDGVCDDDDLCNLSDDTVDLDDDGVPDCSQSLINGTFNTSADANSVWSGALLNRAWVATDQTGYVHSGSYRLRQSNVQGVIWQDVEIDAGTTYRFQFAYLLPSGVDGADLRLRLVWYDNATCTDVPMETTDGPLFTVTDAWTTVSEDHAAPGGSACVRFSIFMTTPDGFELFVDNASLYVAPE